MFSIRSLLLLSVFVAKKNQGPKILRTQLDLKKWQDGPGLYIASSFRCKTRESVRGCQEQPPLLTEICLPLVLEQFTAQFSIILPAAFRSGTHPFISCGAIPFR